MSSDGGGPVRAVLVSGGSGGIGAEVCHALAARGYQPIACYHRNREGALAVVARSGGRTLELDLADDTSIDAALAEVEGLHVAGVVLAGSPPPVLAPFGKIESEELQRQLRVNVVGPHRLLAGLVKRCFRKHKQGSVVGVLTRAMGDETTSAASGMGAYVIGKHGMAGVLALLAADYPWLRVRAIKPGYTETRMLEAFDERFLALQREKIGFSTPQAVAAQIVEEAIGP